MSVCDDCPVYAPTPVFRYPNSRKGDTGHCCPFFLEETDEDFEGNLFRMPPATCPHADALKAVVNDPTLVLLAFPEVVARAIWRDRGSTVVATDVKGEE